jgi:hypothetical protein
MVIKVEVIVSEIFEVFKKIVKVLTYITIISYNVICIIRVILNKLKFYI